MPPKPSSPPADGLAVPVGLFLASGAYYFLSAQEIINNTFVSPEVRQMSALLCASDVSFCLITSRLSRSGANAQKKKRSATKPLTGRPLAALWLLSVFDLVGLVCAFEAIRIGGSAFHQTVGGASIPISCVLNVLITGKTYSRGQLTGIALVVAGLAIKARSLLEGDAPFPLDATAYCLAMCVGYALRGIAMEYLTKVKPNPPSGDRMTLQMGVSGFLAWCAYAAWFVAPRYRELVAEPFAAAARRYGGAKTVALYATHALSRGVASKCIVALVARGGATVLSLAQVVRASVIVVLCSLAFCGSDARQCLDASGAASAALVVAGARVLRRREETGRREGSARGREGEGRGGGRGGATGAAEVGARSDGTAETKVTRGDDPRRFLKMRTHLFLASSVRGSRGRFPRANRVVVPVLATIFTDRASASKGCDESETRIFRIRSHGARAPR